MKRIIKYPIWTIVSLFILAVILFLTWVGINKYYKKPVPQLLWSKSALISPPPESENGWLFITKLYFDNEKTFKDYIAKINDDEYLTDLIYSIDELIEENPPTFSNICNRLDQFGPLATDDFIKNDVYKYFLEAIDYEYFFDDIYTKPFAFQLNNRSPIFTIYELSKITKLDILTSACRGQLSEGIEKSITIIKSFRNLSNTPMLIPKYIGIRILHEQLNILNILLYADSNQADIEVFQNLKEYIDKLDLKSIKISDYIIAQYLHDIDLIDYVIPEGKAEEIKMYDYFDMPINFPNITFFDKGSTISYLNKYYEYMFELSQHRHIIVIGKEPEYFQHFSRMSVLLYNPIGKLIYNLTTSSTLLKRIGQFKEEVVELEKFGNTVKKRVGALLEWRENELSNNEASQTQAE